MAKQNKNTGKQFRDTVRERLAKDPAFKKRLMTEAINEFLSGDPAVGRTIIKDYFQGDNDIQESSALTELLAKSQQSTKEGKVKPFEVAIRDLKIKAQKSWTVKILKGNKITIPADFRQDHDLNPGDEVEFVDQASGLIIIPTKNRPKAYGKLHKLATQVLNDADSATLWLNESQFGLDGARPVVHMKTRKGAKDVENLLMRIEYGVLA